MSPLGPRLKSRSQNEFAVRPHSLSGDSIGVGNFIANWVQTIRVPLQHDMVLEATVPLYNLTASHSSAVDLRYPHSPREIHY